MGDWLDRAMQVIALALFWLVLLAAAGVAIALSFALQLDSDMRVTGHALRAGVVRALLATLALQVASGPPFLALLLTNWGIQWLVGELGFAGRAIWVALPVGLVALVLPPLATLTGLYLGFRTGWLRAKGSDPEVSLQGDVVAQVAGRLGPLNPVRW